MDDQIQLIPMELIDRPVKISRDLIDPERVRELAESIREVGLLQPVVLRRVNGRYETVAGDRRYLAHQLLGLKEIKAIVKELDDRDTVLLRGIENLQRENLTPSEEGKVYLLLKDELHLTVEEIGKRTGKGRSTVKRFMKFAGLPEEIRRGVDEKLFSLAVLETLIQIDDPIIFRMYYGYACAGCTESTAKSWVEQYYNTREGVVDSGGVDGPPGSSLDLEQKPIFITCEVCLGPCEIKKVRNMVVCPECRKKVRGG